ncbi:MAG: hypothetical protein ACM3SU_09400 [Acidobacteriota bacterium]
MEGDALRPVSRRALGALVAAGALLRLWQYAGNTSLWLDEIALAENILHRPLGKLLFTPLDLDQVAPPGFLLLVKSAVMLLGPSDLVLRLVPLLCSLASLGLFVRLARRVLAGWTALFATGLFAVGVPLILYAAEVKQYSGDVAASVLLTLLALDLTEGASAVRFFATGLIGLLVVFFSQAAVFMLAGLALALVIRAFMERARAGQWRRLAWALVPWGAGLCAATIVGRRSMTPVMRAELYRFWSTGFWPLPPRSPGQLLWLPRTLRGFWGQSLFQYPGSVLYLALMLLGFWAIWRRRVDVALLLLGPFAVMLGASAARLYPFSGRLLLCLSPAFLLAAAEGLGFLAGRLRVPAAAAVGLLALPPLFALAENRPVHLHEETRPMLAYVAARRQPQDAIYVYYGAELAFRYYGPRFGLEPAMASFGACHREEPRAYLREIDLFRGRPRLWVIFAHDVPSLGEEALILEYLRRIGIRREGITVPEGDPHAVAAELYDLSIPERLARASSDAFPVPQPDIGLARRLGCGSRALARRSGAQPLQFP